MAATYDDSRVRPDRWRKIRGATDHGDSLEPPACYEMSILELSAAIFTIVVVAPA